MFQISPPKRETVEGGSALSFEVRTEEGGYRVNIRAAGVPRFADSESFLVPLLTLPAMAAGSPLHLPGNVSPRLLASLDTVQDIYGNWYPDLRRVAVEAEHAHADDQSGEGVGAFFSGGVDSCYTLVRHFDEISTLILVHGFDFGLHQSGLRREVSSRLQNLAARLGKRLIEVETDLRAFSNPYVTWRTHYHGAALAGIALVLSPVLRKVYIPASFSYAQLFPWGSHPQTDPLWSTEAVEIVHDGCEADRLAKVSALGAHLEVLNHLRVCTKNPGGAYNCGQCEKCVRTMIGLELSGALGRAESFHTPLTEELVRGARIVEHSSALFARENLDALRRKGSHARLADALERQLRAYGVRALAGQVEDNAAFFAGRRDAEWDGFRRRVLDALTRGGAGWLLLSLPRACAKRADSARLSGRLRAKLGRRATRTP